MTIDEFQDAYIAFAYNFANDESLITTEDALKKMADLNGWEYIGNKLKALILDKTKPEYISVNYKLNSIDVTGHRIEGPLRTNFDYEEFKKSIIVYENLKDYAKGENN